MDLLGPLLVLAAVVGVFAIMLGGLSRIRRRPAFDFRPEDGGALAAGILIALSGAALLGPLGAGAGAVSGAMLGVLFAILRLLGKTVFEIACGVLAVLATAALLLGFFSGGEGTGVDACTRSAGGTRGFAFAVMLLLAVAGGVLGTLKSGFTPTSPLAVFGAAEVIVFLAAPLGVDLASTGWLGWAVGGALAIMLGFAGAKYPSWVIGFAALGVGVATIATAVGFGTVCEAHDLSGLLTAIGFLITYLLVTGGLRGIGLGR
jgi:hypothetical protein